MAIDKYGRELLAVAEKYQLLKLKTCCEEYLSGTLYVENCIDLIFLGDLNQAKTLKETALEYVRSILPPTLCSSTLPLAL